MKRPKKLRDSSMKLQSYTNQPLNIVQQSQQSRQKKLNLLQEPRFKRGDVRSSLERTNKKKNYFTSYNEIAQLKTMPFKNNAITQKLIDSFFTKKISDYEQDQVLFSNTIQGLKPLFKIKKRKLLHRKQQKNQSDEMVMTQSLKNSLLCVQNTRKSLLKVTIQTSFHKSYKSSLQKNKTRYKQKVKSNPEDFDQYAALLQRIQNTALLGKYALKHRKTSS